MYCFYFSSKLPFVASLSSAPPCQSAPAQWTQRRSAAACRRSWPPSLASLRAHFHRRRRCFAVAVRVLFGVFGKSGASVEASLLLLPPPESCRCAQLAPSMPRQTERHRCILRHHGGVQECQPRRARVFVRVSVCLFTCVRTSCLFCNNCLQACDSDARLL